MTTPIQPVPDVILASEFPSLADRPAGTYNAKAKAWADSENAMSIRNREIALTAEHNAGVAKEAADEAVPAAATAVAARDKALEYRNSAQAAAAAAGSGAGLPSLVGNAGKALVVGADEDAVRWEFATPTLGMRHVTAAATITAADQALMLRCTGTFTLSFDPVATLPTGWFCYIKNAGDGDITLDPDGSEQIDGRTSYIMYPGECRLIAHNGAELVSVVLSGFYKVFEASGDFVKPPGYRLFEGRMWGGGGGGTKNASTARGGGGAGCSPFNIPASLIPDISPVVIGSGGSWVSGTTPSAGGNSSVFGLTAGGASNNGMGGHSIGLTTLGVVGTSEGAQGPQGFLGFSSIAGAYTASVPNLITGTFTGACSLLFGTTLGIGGSIFGGAAGGGVQSDSARPPGESRFGGSGGAASVSGDGEDGMIPGGGGGATSTGSRAGNGARGELRIWGII